MQRNNSREVILRSEKLQSDDTWTLTGTLERGLYRIQQILVRDTPPTSYLAQGDTFMNKTDIQQHRLQLQLHLNLNGLCMCLYELYFCNSTLNRAMNKSIKCSLYQYISNHNTLHPQSQKGQLHIYKHSYTAAASCSSLPQLEHIQPPPRKTLLTITISPQPP